MAGYCARGTSGLKKGYPSSTPKGTIQPNIMTQKNIIVDNNIAAMRGNFVIAQNHAAENSDIQRIVQSHKKNPGTMSMPPHLFVVKSIKNQLHLTLQTTSPQESPLVHDKDEFVNNGTKKINVHGIDNHG